jgi:hypothetical protein
MLAQRPVGKPANRMSPFPPLVLAAYFFAAVHIGYKPKLEILALHALRAAQRIFGIPSFCYYALADGIKEILAKTAHGTMRTKIQEGGPKPQLSLFMP